MNLFISARTKLTLFYLAIIMTISLFFSFIIYQGATYELRRIENTQRVRRPNPAFLIDPDIVRETKSRIFFTLLTINAFILGVSGVSGYFLSGKTLEPISNMVEDQKNFISNASHELRTPLSALKTQIEVGLRDTKMNLNDAKKLLKSNLDDVNNMTQLSNYLLKLNRFQGGNDKLEFKKINLANIVKKVIEKNKDNISKSGSKIEQLVEDCVVSGNEESLTELLNILIDNAIKYGDGKKIVVQTKRSKTVEIADNGLGISKDDLPHIFDRFYRGDKSRGKDGFGLGLSIAKQIADNHNAKIKVSSVINKGTTFKVIFS